MAVYSILYHLLVYIIQVFNFIRHQWWRLLRALSGLWPAIGVSISLGRGSPGLFSWLQSGTLPLDVSKSRIIFHWASFIKPFHVGKVRLLNSLTQFCMNGKKEDVRGYIVVTPVIYHSASVVGNYRVKAIFFSKESCHTTQQLCCVTHQVLVTRVTDTLL